MFKIRTFKWWQIGLLKLALLAIGVAIGAYWPEVFSPYIIGLLVVGIALGIYLAFATSKQ
jgi:hypothetical protein